VITLIGSTSGALPAAAAELVTGSPVVVLPTAAAYEHPARAAAGVQAIVPDATSVMVVQRRDASDPQMVEAVRGAATVVLVGGNPMHLKQVVKETPLWDALVDRVASAHVVAVGGAAAALCDPMVDPRGGAFTLGLGLLPRLALIANHDDWSPERLRRTFELAPAGTPVIALGNDGVASGIPGGQWSASGAVHVWVDGHQADITAL
jgi:cyanophycinase